VSRRTTLRAHAKINWTLRVAGKRADGYHDLETLFQSISLHDDLEIEEAGAFECIVDAPGVPAGEQNLALRAARALAEEAGLPPVRIRIEKRIPAGGGLGGGSTDAAAVLRGMPRMFDAAVPEPRLAEIALALGSDVPFFLVGGLALGYGRGEILTPLPDESAAHLVLIVPGEHVSTAEVFGAYRGERGEFNDLEPIVFARYPHLGKLKERLLEEGADRAFMTGSGSTLVGAFEDARIRDRALAQIGRDVRVIAAETIPRAEALG
jgi:4-diphosphocytidyl-2-C-methyl-D-erythritol kinase